jgi:outer membrane biosynthesis protein TonB
VDGSGILCGLIAVLFVITIIPINIWQSLINKYIKKVFKIIIAVALAILFFVAVPSAELEDSIDNISPPSPTTVTITQATEPTAGQITDATTEPINTTTEPVTEPITTFPQIKETEAFTEPNTTKPTEKPVIKPTEPTTKPTIKPTESATESSKPVSKPTEPSTKPSNANSQSDSDFDYVVNTNTKKFHYSYCSSVNRINDENRWDYYGSRDELIDEGYEPCGKCHP